MTKPDFRALCAELIDALDSGIPSGRIRMSPLAERARAALAEPEPEGPTDDELMEAFDGEFAEFFDSSDGFGTTAIPRSEWIKVARAVLARWGQLDGPAVPPLYARQTNTGQWEGADHPSGPWRKVSPADLARWAN